MILINWNIEWADPSGRPRKLKDKSQLRQEIGQRIQQHNPDIVCLTEAPSEASGLLAAGGNTIYSQMDSPLPYGYKLSKGYKVLLWSKRPWRDADNLAVADPPGRFVSGVTQTPWGDDLLIIGVCIPYMGSRTRSATKRDHGQDHLEYLRTFNGLRKGLLEAHKYVVLVGDFKQYLGSELKTPFVTEPCQEMLSEVLGSFPDIEAIPTRADKLEFNGRPSVDHICLQGLRAREPLKIIDNKLDTGEELSDHFGVAADLEKII